MPFPPCKHYFPFVYIPHPYVTGNNPCCIKKAVAEGIVTVLSLPFITAVGKMVTVIFNVNHIPNLYYRIATSLSSVVFV